MTGMDGAASSIAILLSCMQSWSWYCLSSTRRRQSLGDGPGAELEVVTGFYSRRYFNGTTTRGTKHRIKRDMTSDIGIEVGQEPSSRGHVDV